MTRHPSDTPRCAWVILVAIAVVIVSGAEARAEDPAPASASDPTHADLKLAARGSAKVEDRVAALDRVLASPGPLADPDLAARASVSLARSEPAKAARLWMRATETGDVREEIREEARALARAELGRVWPEYLSPGSTFNAQARDQDVAGMAVAFGIRGRGGLSQSPKGFEVDVMAFDAPEIVEALGSDASTWDPNQFARRWLDHVYIADRFDDAMSDDPATARKGMDALVADEAKAFEFLIAVARRGADGTKPGLVPRRARAIAILGIAKEKRAVKDLVGFIQDAVEHHENGWVRVASAYALGDIGDPSAIAGLARVLFYLGDIHRIRDSWDYPGAGNTDIPFEGWNDVENYAIDAACCDSLLRLGVRGAAEWLIRERLNPRSGWWRIRVTQDAVDAIRRSFEGGPTSYQPDAGLPDRTKAAAQYLAWWMKGPKTKTTLDENDPGFKAAADEISTHIGQKSVMELQIAKRAAALVGPAMTPTLLDHLAKTKRKVERAEIAAVLGTVRDRRAIEPLIALTRDEVPNVRASAAEALASLLDSASDPLFSGTSTAGHAEIVARWIAMLDDEDSGPRASAMKALTVAPPEGPILEAVKAHLSATHEDNNFGDYVLAEEIVLLLQTGDSLDKLALHLGEKEVFRRRYVWELLRVALRLEPTDFDPTPDPGTPAAKPIDMALLKAALEKRRAK